MTLSAKIIFVRVNMRVIPADQIVKSGQYE